MQKFKLSELHPYSNEVLTKEQMKKVLGGLASGQCYLVQGDPGNSSCWYATSGNADTLCSRVYPGETCLSTLNAGTGTCTSGCHLN
jgi:hypothetical protein